MLFNDSVPQRFRRLKNSFTPILAAVLVSGIAGIAAGSIKANQDWQGRYDAYEWQMMAAIAQLETTPVKADSLPPTRATVRKSAANNVSIDDIKAAVSALATVERS